MDREIGQVQLRKPVAKDSSPKLFTFDGVFYTEDTTEQIYEVCLIFFCSMFVNVSKCTSACMRDYDHSCISINNVYGSNRSRDNVCRSVSFQLGCLNLLNNFAATYTCTVRTYWEIRSL